MLPCYSGKFTQNAEEVARVHATDTQLYYFLEQLVFESEVLTRPVVNSAPESSYVCTGGTRARPLLR